MRGTKGLSFTDPPRPEEEKLACVSYAWKEEKHENPDRRNKVQEFCDRLSQSGYEVVRDTNAVQLGDRLSEFMRRIGSSDRIYVFLSDAYLKSPNCMFELLQIWRTSCQDPDIFLDRIRVYRSPELKIFTVSERLAYAGYWKEECDATKKNIEQCGFGLLGQTDFMNWQRTKEFANQVNEMLAQITDVLQPANFEEYIAAAAKELGT